ncbi:MAG: hypothetical protein WD049_09425 [Candidatus Paceibacterota bacterium]
MKLGLIVECTTQGLEEKFCPRLLELVAAETGIEIKCFIETMVNKKFLLRDAAIVTAKLLAEGCDRVIVLWDENPPWTPDKNFAKKRCWHIEREHVLDQLRSEDVDLSKVELVCIEREIETWVLHDHRLLSATMSTAHAAKIKKIARPLTIDSPKRYLIRLYEKNGFRFNAAAAAAGFAKNLQDLSHLKRCDTFRYFVEKATGSMPAGWAAYNYVPKGPVKDD